MRSNMHAGATSVDDTSGACLSLLLPATTARPTVEVARWAIAATSRARELLTGSHFKACVRGFRWPAPPARALNILELCITDELGHQHAISFTADSQHDYHLEEPEVPDLVEALHMAAIVIRLLGAQVELDAFDEQLVVAQKRVNP